MKRIWKGLIVVWPKGVHAELVWQTMRNIRQSSEYPQDWTQCLSESELKLSLKRFWVVPTVKNWVRNRQVLMNCLSRTMSRDRHNIQHQEMEELDRERERGKLRPFLSLRSNIIPLVLLGTESWSPVTSTQYCSAELVRYSWSGIRVQTHRWYWPAVTNLKVADSIPDEVIDFMNDLIYALRGLSLQPQFVPGIFTGAKADWRMKLTTSPSSKKYWSVEFSEHYGPWRFVKELVLLCNARIG